MKGISLTSGNLPSKDRQPTSQMNNLLIIFKGESALGKEKKVGHVKRDQKCAVEQVTVNRAVGACLIGMVVWRR
jgi:hypothetical protein